MNIGQKVICVKSHSEGIVTKGKIYPIKNLGNGNPTCSHCNIVLDVGFKLPMGFIGTICGYCGSEIKDRVHWINHDLFRPLEEEKGEATIEDFIDITEPQKETYKGWSILELAESIKKLSDDILKDKQ